MKMPLRDRSDYWVNDSQRTRTAPTDESQQKNTNCKRLWKSIQEVNQLIKQFEQMSKMMKMMQGGKGRK